MIKDGRTIFGSRSNAIYDLLPFVEPGLMLDVGASTGGFTKLMLRKSPQSRVYAFEPFSGNIPYFRKLIGNNDKVTLYEAAVGETAADDAPFYVRSTVTGSESGWQDMAGYSSLGYLVSNDRASTHRVRTVRLDEVVSERVAFMKVDVQGGEIGVLRSADRLLRKGLIDMMFVEFSGEPEVLEVIAGYGMTMYDGEYLVTPLRSRDLASWDIHREIPLSTGKQSYRGWPKIRPSDIGGFRQFILDQIALIGGISTDMICVAPHFLEKFDNAVQRAFPRPENLR